MPFDREGFDKDVPLPRELKIAHIRRAIEYIEKQTSEFVDVFYEQANVFSALVGIFGTKALDSLSPYKKHRHPDVAQQRFPDLSLTGKLNPRPEEALESKGTTRPWPIQSHYNHPGWYIVWRYCIDETKMMKHGKDVLIWRVDIPFLKISDWKYEGSKAGEGKGGRTHTFGIKKPAEKLRGAVVFQLPNIAVKQGKPTISNGENGP